MEYEVLITYEGVGGVGMEWSEVHEDAVSLYQRRATLPRREKDDLRRILNLSSKSGDADTAQSKQEYLFCCGRLRDIETLMRT